MKLYTPSYEFLTRLWLRAALYEPELDADPGQFSLELYVYTNPGWVRVGSISADPGQFLFRSVERAGNYLSSESSICSNVINHLINVSK